MSQPQCATRSSGLLTPRRDLPRWPIKPWTAAVERTLAAPAPAFEKLCLALNNAALIEVHRGRPKVAEALCLWQLQWLQSTGAAPEERRAKYALQPIVNLCRLALYVTPEHGNRLLRGLTNNNTKFIANTKFIDAYDFAIQYCLGDRRINHWLQAVYCREVLNGYLRQGLIKECDNWIERERDALDGSEAIQLLNEARFLLGLINDDLESDASQVPLFVQALHKVELTRADALDCTNYIVPLTITLLDHADATRANGEMIERCLKQVRILETGKVFDSLLDKSISWAMDLNDEVLLYRLWQMHSNPRQRQANTERIAEASEYACIRNRRPDLANSAEAPEDQFLEYLKDKMN